MFNAFKFKNLTIIQETLVPNQGLELIPPVIINGDFKYSSLKLILQIFKLQNLRNVNVKTIKYSQT